MTTIRVLIVDDHTVVRDGLSAMLEHQEDMTGVGEAENGVAGLAQGGRPYQFTNQNVPDVAGYTAHREALAARSLLLDDGRKEAYATPIAFLTASAAADYSIRSGDQVTALTGVLRFSRGSGAGGSEG